MMLQSMCQPSLDLGCPEDYQLEALDSNDPDVDVKIYGKWRRPGRIRREWERRAKPAGYVASEVRALRDKARELTRITGVKHVVDHIVPLAHPRICGLHWHVNMQVVPEHQNLRKGHRYTGTVSVPQLFD